MHDLRFAFPAMLIAFAISSNAVAADSESLPAKATEADASQCREDLQAFDQKLADVGFGVLQPGGYGMSAPSGYYGYTANGGAITPRQKIFALRDVANIYAMDGDEESCQLVVDSMRKTFARHQKLVHAEEDGPSSSIAWRRAHLESAQPITGMKRLMRADIVIGAEIRTATDEKIGEIKDLVLDPARQDIAYVLAARGGFLGLGEELVAIRWKDLQATEDHEIYVLNAPESAFDKAPTVDRTDFERTNDPAWRQALDRFWDENVER